MKRNKVHGLTLIELIVSIAILAIFMVPCSMMITSIVHYNSIQKSRVSNAAIAQNIMEYYKTFDFSIVSLNFTTNNTQYRYMTYNDILGNTNIMLFNVLASPFNTNGYPTNETYDNVLNNSGLSSVNPYNHAIKVVFTYINSMIKIDIIVWDSTNKDSGKIEYATLKRY